MICDYCRNDDSCVLKRKIAGMDLICCTRFQQLSPKNVRVIHRLGDVDICYSERPSRVKCKNQFIINL